MTEHTPTAHLFSGSTVDHYAAVVTAALGALTDRVRVVRRPRSGAPQQDLEELVAGVDLDAPLGDTFSALKETSRLYLEHAVWFHEPGYVAHLNCPVAIPALAADLLASAVNTSVDTYDQSTTATLIERRLIAWAADRAGLGPDADGVFTSGGTQSNLHALLLARDEALAALPGGVLAPGARLRVLATDQAHFSVGKAARLLGLGADAVLPVATDARHRMDPAALRQVAAGVRAAGDVVMAVSVTAGTTDLGRIDPLSAVADVCAEIGAWLHVDAAYGGGLLVSRRRRDLLDGIERADSVTVDFHKTFFQPVASSAVLVRDAATLRHVTHHAAYLNPRGERAPNQVDRSLQTTRRFDALKLWVTLRAMGADAIGAAFDACLDLAVQVHEDLCADPDIEVHSEPTLSTVLFRHRPLGPDGPLDPAAADQLVAGIRERLFEEGEAVVARTVIDGRPWLKLTLLNPATTRADVRAVVELVRAAGEDLLAGSTAAPAALALAGGRVGA
ncbi:pyridoxal phosphate-dependent decarboxylase family protein [Modestobacter sp. VKM Ac-2985]|uniref:pyridoxal phosphate-dependent decarboxylase family protein n=1 Tax=Modestobacter sp. VKM Ac-2985 TaxID=3004139 RepID=UPI0022ABA7AA|nr:aspartate aminotransferase family protein [Modestobacter sp. VKM Ac-2985]MCZ2836219.1 aspartate aminotransferase family protein [Modestobacter sp. VKM Ac-2985]